MNLKEHPVHPGSSESAWEEASGTGSMDFILCSPRDNMTRYRELSSIKSHSFEAGRQLKSHLAQPSTKLWIFL